MPAQTRALHRESKPNQGSRAAPLRANQQEHSHRKADTMNSTARRTIASVFAAGIAVTGATAPANAAEQTQGDGLIQVQIGDITITDAVDIGVAAQVAAQICGVKVGPVAVLGVAVDRSGRDQTVCTTDQGRVTLTQN